MSFFESYTHARIAIDYIDGLSPNSDPEEALGAEAHIIFPNAYKNITAWVSNNKNEDFRGLARHYLKDDVVNLYEYVEIARLYLKHMDKILEKRSKSLRDKSLKDLKNQLSIT